MKIRKTKIVFLANPNNPTGTLASKGTVTDFLARIPDDVLIVMDEAYFEYLSDPSDLLPLIRSGKKPNLLLMRTFSKIYGLSGLRIGYGVGSPELIQRMEKVRQPFNVNAIAPGAFASEMMDGMLERMGDITHGFPRKRLGKPSQLDGTLLYLVSPSSDFVTGATIRVHDAQGAR